MDNINKNRMEQVYTRYSRKREIKNEKKKKRKNKKNLKLNLIKKNKKKILIFKTNTYISS